MPEEPKPRWPWMPARISQSVFPTAVAVAGDLASDNPIRIDGTMEGQLRGTAVTVSRKACVRGSIRAESVRIEGRMDGRIDAASVVVTKHARLTGEVHCATLEVEPGARFAARCRVWPEDDGDGAETPEAVIPVGEAVRG